MSDIKKHISNRLGASGLTPKDMEKPGAHVMVTDGEDLHVLVAKSESSQAIDALEAEVPGYAGRLAVSEEAPLDLGDLGEWRDFAVKGLSNEQLERLAEKSAELRIFAAAKDGEAMPPFYASVDLAFAMAEVIGRGVLAVRPIPPGERDGKSFVAVTPGQRRVIHTLTQRWVDDTVPEETWFKAAEAWRQLQADVYDTGLIGALTLGLAPDRPEAPHREVPGDSAAAKSMHGLSADTVDYLEEQQLEIPPKKASITWVEETIDRLQDAPERVVLDLRELLGRLHDAREREADDMFAVDAGDPKARPAEIVYEGQRSTKRARLGVLSQLEKGLDGLGVPDEVERALAEQLAIAMEPRKKPSLILVAGPKGSAAEPLFELAVELCGKKPLRIQGGDLAEPGWAMLFGHNRGFPTEGDAWLSAANIADHRETAADPAPITFENLKSAGSQEPEDQAHHQRDLLGRIVEWLGRGFVNVYAKQGRAAAKQQETSLAGVVFLARWEGPARELRDLLDGSEELAHLADHVIGLDPMRPEHAVNDLIRRATFDVRQHFGPKGCTLELDTAARSGLEKAFRALGPARALEVFLGPLTRDVGDAIKGAPATKYEIVWSNRLTTREKAGLEQGKPPEGAVSRWFGVKAG